MSDESLVATHILSLIKSPFSMSMKRDSRGSNPRWYSASIKDVVMPTIVLRTRLCVGGMGEWRRVGRGVGVGNGRAVMSLSETSLDKSHIIKCQKKVS